MKTALVTGASRGIGRACAIALAESGHRVIVNYNTGEQEAVSLANDIGGIALRADVSRRDQVSEMLSVCGGVDILVCCAGVSIIKQFSDTTQEDWQHIMGINLGGAINCINGVLPHMIREKAGNIVTISSIWGITGASCEVAYSTSKAAIIGMTKSLAKELGPSCIRVNCVAPGVIDTRMNASLTSDIIHELENETPLGCIGTPKQVADTVNFLVSDKASFITGQVIGVNGGFLI
jgi:3-oxoacyl-[acyl-carrier protein] reductase